MQTHFIGKIAVKAILAKKDKILLVRDPQDTDGTWEIPGGRMDEGETIENTLKREIHEELGAEVKLGKFVYSQQFRRRADGLDGTLHCMLVYEAELMHPENPFTLDPKEVAETKWITKDELDNQKIFDNCRRALLAYWS